MMSLTFTEPVYRGGGPNRWQSGFVQVYSFKSLEKAIEFEPAQFRNYGRLGVILADPPAAFGNEPFERNAHNFVWQFESDLHRFAQFIIRWPRYPIPLTPHNFHANNIGTLYVYVTEPG